MPEPGLARDSDMTHERGRMRALLRPITVPAIAGMRHPTQPDEAALAALMMRAYVGTIDYEGEDEADALVEVRHTLSGGKGTFLWTASHVIERDGVCLSRSPTGSTHALPVIRVDPPSRRVAWPRPRQHPHRCCPAWSRHRLPSDARTAPASASSRQGVTVIASRSAHCAWY